MPHPLEHLTDPLLNDAATWGHNWDFVDPPSYGWSQLATAARFNNTAMVRRLLKAKRGKEMVNVIGTDGRSALHVMALFGDMWQVAKQLIAAGADITLTTRFGDTALAYAERFNRPRLAAVLRQALRSFSSPPPKTRITMSAALLPPPVVRRAARLPPPPPSPAAAAPLFNRSTLACCIHGCHGQGTCVGGECQCAKGTMGFDCANVSSAPPSSFSSSSPSSACPHGRRHGIYVGSLGAAVSRSYPTPVLRHWFGKDCHTQAVRTLSPTANGIYSALDAFLVRLLDDASARAPSADCAQAVWHPLFGHRLYGNTDETAKWKLKAALSSQRLLHHNQEEQLPHIHEEQQDIGACGSPTGLYWPNDVLLSHYGFADCHPLDTAMIVVPPGVRRSPRLLRARPPHGTWAIADNELVATAKAAYAADRIHAPRVRRLFFRGSTRIDKVPPDVAAACLVLNRSADDRRCFDGLYSFGIRQTVQRHLGSHPLVSFNEKMPKQNGSYVLNLRRSEFCLTSPGMGFGVRLIDYISSGCIPVIVDPGRQLRMPLEPSLDYSAFSVRVAFQDIPTRPDIIGNMRPREIRRKREALRDVHKKFLWDEQYGEAYEAVRDSLLHELRRRAAEQGGVVRG